MAGDIGGDGAVLKVSPTWDNRRVLRRLGRALMLRCPRCGSGGLVRWFTLVPECPRCRHHFERHEGYWLGAIAINTVVTIGVFAVVFVGWMVLTWPDPPWTAISVGVVAVTALFPVAFYPWSKTLWVALELSVHPVDGD